MKNWLHITFAFILSLLLVSPSFADIPDEMALVRERLTQLTDDDSSPETQALREIYQQTLQALQQRLQQQTRIDQFRDQINQQPDQLTTLRQQLSEAEKAKALPALGKLPLADLEQLHTVYKAELLELEQQRNQLTKQIEFNDTKLVSLREQQALLKQQREQLDRPLSADTGNGSTGDAQLILQNARYGALGAELQASELELLTLPGNTELATLQLQILNRQVLHQQQALDTIAKRLQTRRRAETEQALSELVQPSENIADHPLLQSLTQEKRNLTEQLRQTLADSEATRNQSDALEQQLAEINISYRLIQQQLELNIGYVGLEMRRLMLQLSKPLDSQKTRNQINQLRLQNLELNRQKFIQQTEKPEEQVAILDQQQQQLYLQLKEEIQQLGKRLRDVRQQLTNELSQLLAVQEQANEQIRQSQELLNRNLLWAPSAGPIDGQWFHDIRIGIQALNQQHEPLINLFRWDNKVTTLLMFIGFITGISLAISRYLASNGSKWAQQLGNVIHDRFSRTFRMFLLPLILTLTLPLLLLGINAVLLNPEHSLYIGLNKTLPGLAGILWFSHTMWFWLKPQTGLFPAHFGMPPQLARVSRRRLMLLLVAIIPMLILLGITDSSDSAEVRSGIGRLAFIGVLLVSAMFWLSLWPVTQQVNQLTHQNRWWQRAEVWFCTLILLNLVMIGLACWGYVFTAAMLKMAIVAFLLLMLTSFMLFKLGLRWLLIEERKLAFDRAKARRAEILAARENEEQPPLSENYLDMQTISDQARVLLKGACFALFLTMLWVALGDLLPTLQVLDAIQLWSSTITVADGSSISDAVTLKDLLTGLLVLVISLFAAYNLPGMLELLVLRHLTLAPGTGYAVTALLKYMLIITGLLSGFSLFGLEWKELQWLVAALGVGLGFGLQEIVANFVSGLVILFEKPVRIGDTVTIGGVTGTVTKIHLRATTVTDWDRKEVVIPNKTFISDQLINWSLSDAITRVIIHTGLAYGSDTELARQLLLEAANDNPRVLQDPLPEAFFMAIGDSKLNCELRVYVSNMTDRLEVTHELNTVIARKFRENGLKIAYPQLDIHLHQQDNPGTSLSK